jgi:hypothetical protein
MSILGKVLAVLNVLAALAFVALAIFALSKTREWAYSGYRHDLALQGLPVDDKETDAEGNLRVKSLTGPVLKDVFKGIGPPEVKTQVEEVQRVKSNLDGKINASENKRKTLARILLPLASSYDRREGLTKLKNGQNLSYTELSRVFDSQFSEELRKEGDPKKQDQRIEERLQENYNQAFEDAKRGGPGGQHDLESQRQAIARLLFQLVEVQEDENPAEPKRSPLESPAYKRFQMVVGWEAAVRAVNEEEAVLAQMVQEGDAILARDRSDFAEAHRVLLAQLAAFAQAVQWEKDFLAFQEALAVKHDSMVKERRDEVQKVKDELAKSQDETKKQLQKQAAKEQDVFAKQRDLWKMFEENKELERKIVELEKAANAAKTGKAP